MINNILHKALLASNKNNKFDWNTPLTFTAEEDSITSWIKLTTSGDPVVDGLKYRTNINNTISDWIPYNIGDRIFLTNVGDYIQFKNTKEQLSSCISGFNYVQFSIKRKVCGFR